MTLGVASFDKTKHSGAERGARLGPVNAGSVSVSRLNTAILVQAALDASSH